jgi:arabinofuranosyltransferase
VVQAAVLALPLILLVAMAWRYRWIIDDGFIYLRVVRQFRDGHGPVFNAGQRVEVFTSPLWFGLLTLADLVTPVRLEWLAVLGGIASTVVGIGMAMAGAGRLWRPTAPTAWLVPFAALPVVALFPFWLWSSGGLETGLTFAWLGACMWVLGRWAGDPTRTMGTGGAVLLGLGWLVRPEMVLYSVAFLAVALLGDARVSGAHPWRVLGAAIALPLAYEVFRMGYYGSVLANTAIAKEGLSQHWDRGWHYLADFNGAYALWVPVLILVAGGYAPLGIAAWRRRADRSLLVAGAFVTSSLLLALWVVWIGGDYIHARLLLPFLFGLCVPVMAVPLTRRVVAGALLVPYAIVAATSLRPVQLSPGFNTVVLGGSPESFGKVTLDDLGWGSGEPMRSWYTGPGYYVPKQAFGTGIVRRRVRLKPGVHLPIGVFSAIGLPSYAMGPNFEVFDVLGLADPIASHLEPDTSILRLAGHEKRLSAPWIVARLAPVGTTIGIEDLPIGSVVPSPLARYRLDAAWARAALRCGPIRRLVDASRADLSVGRFFDNIGNAFGNTTVRIPNDPRRAYRELCGTRTPPEVRALQR